MAGTATNVRYVRSGAINRDSYPDLLSRDFDLIWMRRDEHAGELGQFFNVIPSSSLNYRMNSMGSTLELPSENEDTDAIPNASAAPGPAKDWTVKHYRQQIRATDNVVRADRYDKIVSMMQGLVKGTQRKKEYLRNALFANAFTSATATNGADGLSLCDDSHPMNNTEAGTWDNLTTGALTLGNLQAARLLLDKMVNTDRDYPDPVMAKTLLIPADLRQKAEELVGSIQKPEGALNDPNVLIKGLNIVVNHFASSASAWFLVGDREGEDKGLVEVEFTPTNVKDNKPSDNPDIVFARRSKFSVAMGLYISQNIVGSSG